MGGNIVKERLAKLLCVKSIMTLTFTGVVAYMAITNKLATDSFFDMFKTIVIFYFGTQYAKKTGEA